MTSQKIVVTGLVIAALVGSFVSAHAWAGPPATAPNSNVSAPLNIGSSAQTKSGALSIGGVLDATSLAVWGGATLNYNQPTVYFQDTNAKSGMIQVNDGWMYFLSGCGTASLTWCQNSGRWPLQINLANNAAYFGGEVRINEGAAPEQELGIDHNQIWKTVTTGDDILYLQSSCEGCEVQIGDGAGNPNDLLVKGTAYASAFMYSSDARLKKGVATLRGALQSILALRPVSFVWNQGQRAGQEDVGFIAQEVERIVPEVVTEDSEGYKAVDYSRLVPVLVGAIKEQQREIDALRAEVRALKEAR